MNDVTQLYADESNQEAAAKKAGEASLIENFGIRRLHGYRTISLTSEYAATIIIAKNGTGKTTLLAVMDAVLKRQYFRLRNLEFSEIFLKLRNQPELVLTHDDLLLFLQVPSQGEIIRLATRVGVSNEALFEFLLSDFANILTDSYADGDANQIAQKIIQSYQYDLARAIRACQESYIQIIKRSPALYYLDSVLNDILSEYEILYLPTYRRVELALTDDSKERGVRRRTKPKISVASSSLHVGNIQFGLSDISERLEELNRDIIFKSNSGYREISENIINELIRGYEVSDTDQIPTLEELKLFFSRLESNDRRYGHFFPPISPPEYEKIYIDDDVPEENRRFLLYFLGKLARVIRTTEDVAGPVEQFVSRCNKYLSSAEPSTKLKDEHFHASLKDVDAKILLLDKSDLSVKVRSLPYKTPILLDSLSSGEKQMISLFAKLYLYPKKKIVLIDEPELSLSLDWQRDILVDVLLSPLCEQVMAITHSPFVFDNSLEPFARSIYLKVEALSTDSGPDENL